MHAPVVHDVRGRAKLRAQELGEPGVPPEQRSGRVLDDPGDPACRAPSCEPQREVNKRVGRGDAAGLNIGKLRQARRALF
eukprot:2032039-Lingulodinium_polyedra.AAC.1